MSVNTNNTPDFITLASYPQAIAHIDCDAFFASCEQARDPALKGKPVITGRERGIVSCASYEAKALGVSRGVSLRDVKKICPSAIILPSDYELYSIYSQRVFSIIRRFTPDVEEYSIDEAFCDLAGLRRMYRTSYAAIALKIKEAVQAETGLTVSVGLSLSKTLAKICSKHRKPDGFVALPGRELHEFLKDIPLERVCGFGPNTVALLNKYRIMTVLDYIKRPQAFAKEALGKTGVELWMELRGIEVYKVSTSPKEKYLTISKTKTFMPASKSREFVKAQLMRNLESAFIKLRRHGLGARNLIVYLRKVDFTDQAAEGRINRHSSSTLDFTALCSELFERIFEEGPLYRASGMVLGDIKEEGVDSVDLFDDPIKVEGIRKLSEAVDKINSVYGKHTVHLAASDIVSQKGEHPRNSFRRRLGIPLLKLR